MRTLGENWGALGGRGGTGRGLRWNWGGTGTGLRGDCGGKWEGVGELRSTGRGCEGLGGTGREWRELGGTGSLGGHLLIMSHTPPAQGEAGGKPLPHLPRPQPPRGLSGEFGKRKIPPLLSPLPFPPPILLFLPPLFVILFLSCFSSPQNVKLLDQFICPHSGIIFHPTHTGEGPPMGAVGAPTHPVGAPICSIWPPMGAGDPRMASLPLQGSA